MSGKAMKVSLQGLDGETVNVTAFVPHRLDEFDYDIVGESNHQTALLDLARSDLTEDGAGDAELMALLIPDSDNKYDSNAVAVYVSGLHVGHLPREDAATFIEDLEDASDEVGEECQIVICQAKLKGGFMKNGSRTHIGIVLDLEFPLV